MAFECTQVQVYAYTDGEEDNPVDFFFTMTRDQVLLTIEALWLFVDVLCLSSRERKKNSSLKVCFLDVFVEFNSSVSA